MFPLFPLGQIVATPGALAALERAKQTPTCFFARHAIGDWGELEPTDVAENKYSLIHGFRLLSSYQTDAGEKLWIITEADRSATIMSNQPISKCNSLLARRFNRFALTDCRRSD